MNSRVEIFTDYNLKQYNTFGIEAFAKYYCKVQTVEELKQVLALPKFRNTEKLVLGGGSNILFTGNFDGLAIKNEIKGIDILQTDEEYTWVKAGAGEIWHDFVLYCIANNLAGVENLSLIPGTVGAAPIQNIGAYGVEMKDVFESLEALSIEDCSSRSFKALECCFGYRNSIFKQELKGKYIITSVLFKLRNNPVFNVSYGAIQDTLTEMGINELNLKTISDAVVHIRECKLPNPAEIGNAGSFFKNPEIPVSQFEALKNTYPTIPSYPAAPGMVKVPAGWLNEQCGWKGKQVGNTGVHKNQALVLVNYGNAQGLEVKNLSEAIKASVLAKFGIQLETEVNIL